MAHSIHAPRTEFDQDDDVPVAGGSDSFPMSRRMLDIICSAIMTSIEALSAIPLLTPIKSRHSVAVPAFHR